MAVLWSEVWTSRCHEERATDFVARRHTSELRWSMVCAPLCKHRFDRSLLLTLQRYTKTTILSPAVVEHLESKGVEFSLVEDCAAAMVRISTDKSINGVCIQRDYEGPQVVLFPLPDRDTQDAPLPLCRGQQLKLASLMPTSMTSKTVVYLSICSRLHSLHRSGLW